MKIISFIIVNYKGLDYTLSCLASIKKNIRFAHEVIIVDNSPTNEEYDFLKSYFFVDDSIAVYHIDNKGFGNANNYGVMKSSGEVIFLLNNDAQILEFPNFSTVTNIFEGNENIALIAPKVLNPDLSIQPNTSTFLNLFSSTIRYLKIGAFLYKNKFFLNFISGILASVNKEASSYFKRNENQDSERRVEWSSGCAMIIRKKDFIEVGMFDENIFMYSEDEELCYRFYKNGQHVYYLPKIIVVHQVGASTGSINEMIEIEKVKSELYFYEKHFPTKKRLLKSIFYFTSAVLSPFNKRHRILLKSFWAQNKLNK